MMGDGVERRETAGNGATWGEHGGGVHATLREVECRNDETKNKNATLRDFSHEVTQRGGMNWNCDGSLKKGAGGGGGMHMVSTRIDSSHRPPSNKPSSQRAESSSPGHRTEVTRKHTCISAKACSGHPARVVASSSWAVIGIGCGACGRRSVSCWDPGGIPVMGSSLLFSVEMDQLGLTRRSDEETSELMRTVMAEARCFYVAGCGCVR